MTTYAIGDVQGCFEPLQRLLDKIQFNPAKDHLWFVGDLINRGPQSLETLRFIYSLKGRVKVVLGNHDIHLLAMAWAGAQKKKTDTLDEILNAPDCEELLTWLASQPLIHHDATLNMTMVHAGIAPQWTIQEALQYSKEVETVLQSNKRDNFLRYVYGNEPNQWSSKLKGIDRLRCIVNYFTRMRYCYADGRLNLSFKGELDQAPSDLIPWFLMPDRKTKNENIVFGHWASLNGKVNTPHLHAIDTGCAWGRTLTALCLESLSTESVPMLPEM
jgi:bis(5'-nucleosyl)-tetraphosphatase (symmetrical)